MLQITRRHARNWVFHAKYVILRARNVHSDAADIRNIALMAHIGAVRNPLLSIP